MISSWKIVKIARKWKSLGVIQRRRIGFFKGYQSLNQENSTPADKGHFIVYTIDQRRFMIPLKFLRNRIFNDLLKISEEEFGLAREKPITLPCEALVMEYIISLISRGTSKELEKVLLSSIICSSNSTNSHLSSSLFFDQHETKRKLVCSY